MTPAYDSFILTQLLDDADRALTQADQRRSAIRFDGLWALLKISHRLRSFITYMPDDLKSPRFAHAVLQISDRLASEKGLPLFSHVAVDMNKELAVGMTLSTAARLHTIQHFAARQAHEEFGTNVGRADTLSSDAAHLCLRLGYLDTKIEEPLFLQLAGFAQSLCWTLQLGPRLTLGEIEPLLSSLAVTIDTLGERHDNLWFIETALDLTYAVLPYVSGDTQKVFQNFLCHNFVALAQCDPHAAQIKLTRWNPLYQAMVLDAIQKALRQPTLSVAPETAQVRGNLALLLLSRIKESSPIIPDAQEILMHSALSLSATRPARPAYPLIAAALYCADQGSLEQQTLWTTLERLSAEAADCQPDKAIAAFIRRRKELNAATDLGRLPHRSRRAEPS